MVLTAAQPDKDLSDLHRLRTLILGADYETLFEFKTCLEDPSLLQQKIAGVVSEAIAIRNESDDTVTTSLAPVFESSLLESVTRRPQNITQAIYPVIGPAIRTSISQALTHSVETLNQSLQDNFSLRSLGWRFDAWRTGRSFGEVAILNTLDYEVRQVFLIHKETSVLLQHVVSDTAVVKDSDMVSGMLSAIQRFVSDSFSVVDDESLHTLKMGDLTLCIETGPDAVLAAVVRGTVPRTLQTKLAETLEELHTSYGKAFGEFEGYTEPFSVTRPALRACLVSRKPKGGNSVDENKKPWALIVLLAFAIAALGYWQWSRLQTRNIWSQSVQKLESEPGYVVISAAVKDGKYTVRGLRDANARAAMDVVGQKAVSRLDIDWQLEPYYSADTDFVFQRVSSLIAVPQMVSYSIEGTTLKLSGQTNQSWIERTRPVALAIVGIDQVDMTGLEVEPSVPAVRMVPDTDDQLFEQIRDIQESVFYFDSGEMNPKESSVELLPTLIESLHRLHDLAATSKLRVEIRAIGHSDPTGESELNRKLSQQRANAVIALIKQDLSRNIYLQGIGMGSSNSGAEPNAGNARKVRLDVTITKTDLAAAE